MTIKSSLRTLTGNVADHSNSETLTGLRIDCLTDQVGGKLINDEAFLSSLMSRIMTDDLVARLAHAVTTQYNDPFDSIYIADLRPDVISAEAISEIERVAGIEDVSSTISFDDELD